MSLWEARLGGRVNIAVKVMELALGIVAWAVLATVHNTYWWGVWWGQHYVMAACVTCWLMTLVLMVLAGSGKFSNDTLNLVYGVLAAIAYVAAAVIQCWNANRNYRYNYTVYERHIISASFAVGAAMLYCADIILTLKLCKCVCIIR
ncbi:Hypp9291 [Branchiostoma lanceolatum]|uniref:Hypp9291 protein n=1 Tax=Branchiostoma lanceolatum TaxID=7740 RepID=A0A8J9ZEX7_BRALA|nr:Hypp9291 [Branchiostoma lanceolatum]